MTAKKRGLNKGLDALLSQTLDLTKLTGEEIEESSGKNTQLSSGFVEINVKQLVPGRYQPRRTIDESDLEPLANSIKEQGILQPIVVRAIESGGYEIIAGERRWRAAQVAGLATVPVIIKDVPDEAALAIAVIENIQRENLNPMEEALAFERLAAEFGLSHEKIARAVGKSRTTVTNIMRLLGLEDEVKVLLERGDLDLGHAKVLLALTGKQQVSMARDVVARRLSVRETERLLENYQAQQSSKYIKPKIDPDVRSLEKRLSEKLGSKVKIYQSNKGKGKVVLGYNSLDELDGILEHIL